MKTYAGVTFTTEADMQLQGLIDLDIRYEIEVMEIDWLLRRDPEGLSTPKEIDGQIVYVFVTQQKKNGPQRLAVSWRPTKEPPYLVEIRDIRQFP